ncbi:hypothetical protein GCM10022296_19690 [Secundilactobacillus similis DSM 23365 = JCM 2765]
MVTEAGVFATTYNVIVSWNGFSWVWWLVLSSATTHGYGSLTDHNPNAIDRPSTTG